MEKSTGFLYPKISVFFCPKIHGIKSVSTGVPLINTGFFCGKIPVFFCGKIHEIIAPKNLHIFTRVHWRAINIPRPKNAGFLRLKNRCP